MKSALTVVLCPLFAIGVFGYGTETSDVELALMEGNSVTLKSGVTEIQNIDKIEWRFNGTRIAKISSDNIIPSISPNGQFGKRLQLDNQTGDLKISNIKTTDSGQYKLKISSSRGSPEKTFTINVGSAGTVKSVSLLEGDLIILKTDVPEIKKKDKIQWRFEHQNPPVAEINKEAGIFNTSDGPDGRFRDRLQLNRQTGSLIIKDIETKHSGLYEVEITSTSISYTIQHTQSFNVTVRDVVVSVMAGDSVTLHTGFNITHKKHAVLWFDDQDKFITDSTDATGDLTIRNIQSDQSKHYKVKIISSSDRDFRVRTFHVNISGVFSSEKDGVKTVSVKNGDSVTLQTNVTDIQNDVPIEWMFENIFIAKTDGKSKNILYNNAEVKFKNNLDLDIQTGALSIKNSSTEHTGLYQLKIINNIYTIQKSFNVTVSAVSGLSLPTGIGGVVGVVVGVLLVVLAAAICVYCCWFKKPKRKIIREEDGNPNLLHANLTEMAETS